MYGQEFHIVKISGDVTDAGRRRTNNEQGKIELLGLWMLDAEFRNTKAHVSVKNTIAHDILELKGALLVYKLSESPENAQTHYFTLSCRQCV